MTPARPIIFECGGSQLLGMCHMPDTQPQALVVMVVGGPQYRVGSHRMFVELARQLAARNIASFRFDCRGMGDSDGAFPGFENLDDDIRCAIDVAIRTTGVRSVVLFGLCDGASASAIYVRSDPRVSALIMLNPWVSDSQLHAATQIKHYYARRVLSTGFWRRLVSGEFKIGNAISGLRTSLRASRIARSKSSGEEQGFVEGMLDGITSFAGGILILLSQRDLVAREFEELARTSPAWASLIESSRVDLHHLADMDHTLSAEGGVAMVADRCAAFVG